MNWILFQFDTPMVAVSVKRSALVSQANYGHVYVRNILPNYLSSKHSWSRRNKTTLIYAVKTHHKLFYNTEQLNGNILVIERFKFSRFNLSKNVKNTLLRFAAKVSCRGNAFFTSTSLQVLTYEPNCGRREQKQFRIIPSCSFVTKILLYFLCGCKHKRRNQRNINKTLAIVTTMFESTHAMFSTLCFFEYYQSLSVTMETKNTTLFSLLGNSFFQCRKRSTMQSELNLMNVLNDWK